MATMTSSSTTPTSPASSPSSKHNGTREPPISSVYSTIMTPVNFVIFLFSLLLVELRYSLARAKDHPDPTSRLPSWLHQLIYRRRPYLHGAAGQDEPGRWYYHTKQKKLMKMEASEAFQLQSTVLFVLATIAVAATAVFYYAVSRLYAAVLTPSWRGLAVAAPQAVPMA